MPIGERTPGGRRRRSEYLLRRLARIAEDMQARPEVLDVVRARKFAHEFNVTPDTIRRDMKVVRAELDQTRETD